VDKQYNISLTACTDSQLAVYIQKGDADAFVELTARYLDLIRAKSAPFHCTFLDRDDFCQEGLWGLYHAACSYQQGKGCSFSTYAGICIQNHVITAYRKAITERRQPPNGFVPLSDGETFSAPDTEDPETILLSKERMENIQFSVEHILTKMEQQVLVLYLNGCSYAEIAQKMRITQKAADNALQRVRQKLRKQS
jgi:RNA polymerase sporulation-specific sigma factor